MALEIHIRDDQKLVEIWLNRREQGDPELRGQGDNPQKKKKPKKYN